MAMFTQKPLVYVEQLSQSTQRNTLQYFLKRFYFIASRSKRLATEIERMRQLTKQLLLVSLILHLLLFHPPTNPVHPQLPPQVLSTPSAWGPSHSCPMLSRCQHDRPSEEHPVPAKTCSWGRGKAPQGTRHSTAPQRGRDGSVCICFSTPV